MRIFLYSLLGIVGILLLLMLAQGVGLVNIKFWGPKYQEAHREIFEETKSYNHGMIRDLENLCMQYQTLDSQSHKDAIAATIRHRRSAFTGDLPLHVRQCLTSIN